MKFCMHEALYVQTHQSKPGTYKCTWQLSILILYLIDMQHHLHPATKLQLSISSPQRQQWLSISSTQRQQCLEYLREITPYNRCWSVSSIRVKCLCQEFFHLDYSNSQCHTCSVSFIVNGSKISPLQTSYSWYMLITTSSNCYLIIYQAWHSKPWNHVNK